MKLIKRRAAPSEASSPAVSTKKPQLDFERLRQSFVLLSNFRSGSHMFKLSVGQLADMAVPPEPLNLTSGLDEGYFFNNYIEDSEFDPKQSYVDGHTTFYNFIAKLYSIRSDDRPLIIDIKYSQAYLLGMNQKKMTPVILDTIVDWGVPIVHLVRRDTVAQAISHLVALKSGEYLSNMSRGESSDKLHWLDPVEVLETARTRKWAVEAASRQLETLHARTLTVYYEDIIAPERMANTYRQTFQFLNRYADFPTTFEPITKKQNSAGKVANIEEIMKYITINDPLLMV